MRRSITPTESSRTTQAMHQPGSMPGAGRSITFPFAAVVGCRAEKRAMLLLAVEPELRGVLIATAGVSTKSTLARAFGSLLTLDEGCEYELANRLVGAEPDTIHLPIGVTEDRLLGGLDLEQTLATGKPQVSSGILARAHGRVLFVEDVNLLAGNTVAHLAHTLDRRWVPVEREGVSASHQADFMFLGTYNAAEGEPNTLLRERIGMILNAKDEPSSDEMVEMMSRAFRFDKDPSTFAADFALETAEIRGAIQAARARLPQVVCSKDHIRQLALAAMRLGVEGNRADVLTLKSARANAALSGRDVVNEDDLVVGIQLVLAPRATRLPHAENVQSDVESSSETPADEFEQPEVGDREKESSSPSIEDLLLQAIDARIPEDAIIAAQRTLRSGRTGRGRRSRESTALRGRYAGSGAKRNREARIAIDATLRAAAPFQLSRRELPAERAADYQSPAESLTRVPRRRIKIQPDDLRFKKFKHRSGTLFILAVDASGSMALNRMAQAKGALTRLLQQAYLHRDKVSLISFRGGGAEVLLAPTRSVELAKRLLDALPSGGGTPLAAGVCKAIELARFARLKGTDRAMLVLFTDGRANVALRGDKLWVSELPIEHELRNLGALLQAEEIASVVVDTKSRFLSNGEGDFLADMLGARYVYLPRPDAATVYKAIIASRERRAN